MELEGTDQGDEEQDAGAGGALLDFSFMLMEDIDSGKVRTVEHYQERFPGYEEEIKSEFNLIHRAAEIDPEEPASHNPSDRRVGNYKIENELGRGGQATVYAARDTRMDRSVALKVLSSTLGRIPPESMERFRREADSVANIDHPCICDVFEADFESDPPYIAMRLVSGESIRQHIQRAMLVKAGELEGARDAHLPCNPQGEEELFTVLRAFERLARALHAAHEGSVIHRDIKPANLIMDESGTPIILDFGLARVGGEDDSNLTMTGEVFGTPAYMPPELLRGQVDEPGPTLDVYALAVTLYECLTLKRPFDATTPEALYNQILEQDAPSARVHHPELPKEVAIVLATALEKDLNRRYGSALDLAEELRRICDREPILALPAGPSLRLKRWLQRHPALGLSIAASVIFLVGGLTISLTLLNKVTTERDRKEELLVEVVTERDRKEELLVEVAEERDQKEQVLEIYKATYYRENAKVVRQSDPLHAMLLAAEAYRREPLEVNHREIRVAMEDMYEVRREKLPFQNFGGGSGFVSDAAIHPSEPWIVYSDRFDNLWAHDLELNETTKILQGQIPEDADLEVKKEMAKAARPRMLLEYDREGVNLFLTRRDGEVIEVRSPDAREVRHELQLEGEVVHLLSQTSTRALTTTINEKRQMYANLGLWDLETGDLISKMTPDEVILNWAKLSPDGALVAVCFSPEDGGRSRTEIWDMEAEQKLTELPGPLGTPLPYTRAVWSPLGDSLFTFSDVEDVTEERTAMWRAALWSLPDGALIAELDLKTPCEVAVFSEDGQTLATCCSGDGLVLLWDALTGEATYELEGHDPRKFVGAAFSPEQPHLLATTSYDQITRVWDVKRGEQVNVFKGLRARPSDGGESWIEDQFFTLSEKGILHAWQAGSPLWPKVFSSSFGDVAGALSTEGGETIFLISKDGDLELLDLQTEEVLATHRWEVSSPIVSAVEDLRKVVIAKAESRSIAVEWNWETGVERTVSTPDAPILVMTPFDEGDPRHLVFCESTDVEVWDFQSAERLYVIRPTEQPTSWVSLAKCPIKGLVATGASDGYVRLWDMDSGALVRELGPFVPHNGAALITYMIFTPDGESIYVSSQDARVREWLVDTGELISERPTHTTRSLHLIGDEHLMASALYRGVLVLFERGETLGKSLQLTLGSASGTVSVTEDSRYALFSDGLSPTQLLDLSWLKDRERARVGSFSIDPSAEEQSVHFEYASFSPDDQQVMMVGDGKLWIWPTDLLSAAEEMSPVGIDYFGGLPSPSLTEAHEK